MLLDLQQDEQQTLIAFFSQGRAVWSDIKISKQRIQTGST
jgi:hypothetical protein